MESKDSFIEIDSSEDDSAIVITDDESIYSSYEMDDRLNLMEMKFPDNSMNDDYEGSEHILTYYDLRNHEINKTPEWLPVKKNKQPNLLDLYDIDELGKVIPETPPRVF